MRDDSLMESHHECGGSLKLGQLRQTPPLTMKSTVLNSYQTCTDKCSCVKIRQEYQNIHFLINSVLFSINILQQN